MAGPEPAWPKKKQNGGGELFSPSHPPAWRTNIVLHTGETYTENEVKVEGKEELPGIEEAMPCWSGCFAGGAVVEAGGGVVAHGRQLQAAVMLFQAAEREVTALLFIFLANPLLFQTRLLSSLSLSLFPVCFPFLFLPFPFRFSMFFFSFLCVFPPPVTGLESNIYRVKGRGGIPIAALSLHMGRGAFLPCYDAEGGGQWVWFAETAPDEGANGCGLQGRLRWLLIMRGSVHAGKK